MWFGKSTKWVLLVLLSLIWGSSFILMKRTLQIGDHLTFSHEQLGALRIGVSYLFFLPKAFGKLKQLTKQNWKWIVLIGVIGNLIPAYLFAKALSNLDSSLTGVMNGMVPLYTLLIGVLFFKLKVKPANVIGIAVGLVGTVFIFYSKDTNWSTDELLSIFCVIGATVCYGLGLNIINAKLKEVPSLTVSTLSFFFIGPLALGHFFTTDFSPLLEGDPFFLQSLGYVTLLSFLATAIALVIFYHLVSISNSLFASSVTYLIPFVALAFGYADKELISIEVLGALGMILVALFLISRK